MPFPYQTVNGAASGQSRRFNIAEAPASPNRFHSSGNSRLPNAVEAVLVPPEPGIIDVRNVSLAASSVAHADAPTRSHRIDSSGNDILPNAVSADQFLPEPVCAYATHALRAASSVAHGNLQSELTAAAQRAVSLQELEQNPFMLTRYEKRRLQIENRFFETISNFSDMAHLTELLSDDVTFRGTRIRKFYILLRGQKSPEKKSDFESVYGIYQSRVEEEGWRTLSNEYICEKVCSDHKDH